jgi:hypothetical protein
MTQSSRQRGKLVRKLIKSALETNRIEHSKAVAANLSQPAPKPDFAAKLAKSQGPARFDAKPASTSRERLKGGSYGVGFQGPRGYGTPTGIVSKQEGNGERLAPNAVRPAPAKGKQRFALDGERLDTVARETVQRKRAGEKRWKVIDLNDK